MKLWWLSLLKLSSVAIFIYQKDISPHFDSWKNSFSSALNNSIGFKSTFAIFCLIISLFSKLLVSLPDFRLLFSFRNSEILNFTKYLRCYSVFIFRRFFVGSFATWSDTRIFVRLFKKAARLRRSTGVTVWTFIVAVRTRLSKRIFFVSQLIYLYRSINPGIF